MTDNIKALDFNGVKIELDTNTILIKLNAPGAATVETLIDARDGSTYQVDASKKAHIVYIGSQTGMGSAGDKIIYADNEDGTTNAVTLFDNFSTNKDTIAISAEIPASKYINKDSAAAGDIIVIYIVEEAA